MTSKQKRRLAIIFVLIIGAIAGSYLALSAIQVDAYVRGSGIITTPIRSLVLSPEKGAIKEILVEDSQRVEAGQVLIRLEDADALSVIAHNEAEVRLAQAELEKQRSANAETIRSRKHALQVAKMLYDNAAKELERAEELLKTETISAEQRDKRSLELEVAKANYEAEEAFSTETIENHIAVLQRRVELAEQQLARSRELLANRRVTSPISGVLSLHALVVGEMLDPGRVVGEVFDDSAFVARAKVAERSLHKVEKAQTASLSLSAWPRKRFGYFSGVVQTVSEIVTPHDSLSGEGYFVAEIALDPTQRRLKPGMSVEVRIDVGRTSLLDKIFRLD